MSTGSVGFCFRERMAGPLSAGTDDPQTGAARGRAANTIFVADLTVNIDDLAACIRDPEHSARLTGSATFPGLATAQPIRDGSLQMYVSDPVTHTKLMRYRFAFSDDTGKPFYLEGTKFMRTPGPSTREQITLYTRLREASSEGRVWGAGVLVFRLRDLPSFVLSMRAHGVSRLSGLRQFLGFARRELATPASQPS